MFQPILIIMKLSDSKIIKALHLLISFIMVLYFLFILTNLFMKAAPGLSHSVKGYKVYGVEVEKVNAKSSHSLDQWFNDAIIVQPTDRALVHVRFKSYDELFSFPAILYQASQIIYWLLIGFLIICIKKLFGSFSKDKVFTKRNASLIMFGAITLMWLPIMRWITQSLFINCINKLNLNDSGYVLHNGVSLMTSETLIGLALLAFGLVFKIAVNIKTENESFI